MFRPARPRTMGNNYRNHAPFTNQWNQYPRPQGQFQMGNRPPRHFGPPLVPGTTSEEHWCETCDRGFPTLDLLDKHKQQHQKCNIDGCQFVAHPKVITKHIQMQHSTGLYKKISKLDNPEEITKWREERKKRYPTQANIEKKAAESKEKIERGEKMALRCQRNNARAAGNNVDCKQKQTFNKRPEKRKPLRPNRENIPIKDQKTHPPPKKIPKTVPVTEEKSKLRPFGGIMNIVFDEIQDSQDTCDDSQLIEDDVYEKHEDTQEKSVVVEPVICGALTSLMCDYSSSDEDVDNTGIDTENKLDKTINCIRDLDKISHEKIIETLSDLNQTPIKAQNCYTMEKDLPQEKVENGTEGTKSDDEGPEEVKVIKINDTEKHDSHDLNHVGLQEVKVIKINDIEIHNSHDQIPPCKVPILPIKRSVPHRHEYKHSYKPKHKVPSTLLQKLLSKEIRQERNIVLQCIRSCIRSTLLAEELVLKEVTSRATMRMHK